MEKPADFATRMGGIEVPLYTFFEGPIKSRDVKILYQKNGSTKYATESFMGKDEPGMVVPKDVADLRSYILTSKLEANAKKEKPQLMVNGAQYGCTGVFPDDESEPNKVSIGLRGTWFFDHLGISQALDTPFYKDGTVTLRQHMDIDPRNHYDFLPHACGNNVSVISSDGYFIWMNRGEINAQYPNKKGVPAGFGNRLKDIEDGVVSPRMTAKREAGEESGAGIKNPDDLLLAHIATPLDDLHTEIGWLYESKDKKASEMLRDVNHNSKYEGKLFTMPADLSDGTIKHLKNPGEWVLSHWMLGVQQLIKNYGKEAVTRKLSE